MLGLAVFLVSLVWSLLTGGFSNDHFAHLSLAAQMRLGDIPAVDFFAPGGPLTVVLSWGALSLFGHNLLGDALLTGGFVAAGVALTSIAAFWASRSWIIGAVIAAAMVAMAPQLYNYPKVFLFAAAVCLTWAYIDRPRTRLLVGLALLTGIAALFRYDLGLLVGLYAGATILVVGSTRDGARKTTASLVMFAGVALAAFIPWLLFLGFHGELGGHLRATQARASAARTALYGGWIPNSRITVPTDEPLVALTRIDYPRVHIRWKTGVTATKRRTKEQNWSLVEGHFEEKRTWQYRLADTSKRNLRRLLRSAAVEDTHHIDVENVTVADPVVNRGIYLSPALVSSENRAAILAYIFFSLPFIAFTVLIIEHRFMRDRPAEHLPNCALKIAGLACLCVLLYPTLVRGEPETRLADIAAPTLILAAWLMCRVRAGWQTRRRPFPGRTASARLLLTIPRLLMPGLATAAAVLLAAVVFWGFPSQILRSGILSGPITFAGRLADSIRDLQQRPLDRWAPPGSIGLRAVARYVNDCTLPSDRILVTWFAPDVYFYSERGVAGGAVHLDYPWYSSVAEQHRVVERLSRHRVPLVIQLAHRAYPFAELYPVIHEYISTHYEVETTSSFDGNPDRPFAVLRSIAVRPSGTYDLYDLPCFK